MVRSAPIDVAAYLKQYLFEGETACVMTSATLSSSKDLSDFARKVGSIDAEMGRVASPFDYERQTRVRILKRSLLAKKGGRGGFQTDVAGLVREILSSLTLVEGGALVLFTNYRDMQRAALAIQASLSQQGRELFVQGGELSRTEMIRCFKEAGNAVLFGTDSFWTGIDVPGPALEQVIVTKLPFENPSHPVQEAKVEWVQKNGGNPFMEISVPDAVIKFRQGLGRLIRSRSDQGILTVLDNRVLTKPYGKYFLGALPKAEYEII